MTVGDLKQELAAGSTISTVSGITFYSPKAASTQTPALVGSTGAGGLENLVKRSANASAFYPANANYDTATYPAANRAAAAPTTTTSLNGRSITTARWNKSFLLQKATLTSDTDASPVAAFVPPDWINVARNGSNPTTWNANMITSPTSTSSVIGRYAYAIYDEGGLLDLNVAGYPNATTPLTSAQIGRKGSSAYTNLKQVPGVSPTPGVTGLSAANQTKFANNIVGWRNYVSAAGAGSLVRFSASPPPSLYSFASGDAFFNSIRGNNNGFLTVSNTLLSADGQSDRIFSSRQELIALLLRGMASSATDRSGLQYALQYLGTFSRELNRPTWKPSTPAGSTIDYAAQMENSSAINRNLATVRVTGVFTRFDGTSAAVGEPLIKTRFPLTRLSWLTYKGPSQPLVGHDLDPSIITPATSDPIVTQLLAAGVPLATIEAGTSANIKKCFGLVWDTRPYQASPRQGQQWFYTSPTSANFGGTFDGTSGTSATIIKTLGTVQSENRESDFFELLKTVILNGSLGLGSNNTATFIPGDPKYYDTTNGKSADYQLMQIGANVMDEWDTDNVSTWINFNGNEPTGIENIPFLSKLVFCPNFPPQGTSYFDAWLVPSLWNPHQNASAATGTIRMILSGSGTYTAVGVDKAGSVTTTTTSPPMVLPASMDLPASGFGTPTPPSDPNPVPLATTGGVMNVGAPEKYYAFHYPFTSTTPNAALVEQQDADSAWPDFGSGGMKLELQVQIPGTSPAVFVPYDTWNIAATGVPLKLQGAQKKFNNSNNPDKDTTDPNYNSNKLQDPEFVALDPRTVRFGVWGTGASGQTGGNAKKDYYSGATDSMDQGPSANRIEQITSFQPVGASFNVGGLPTSPADLSLYATNGGAGSNPRYVDLDAVQRRGDWTTDPAGTNKGTTIMFASARAGGGTYRDRPNVLSAPFQSVAELGQVFRDQPWKTLAFTIANSGDAGLLDAFTLQDVPLTAGRTSLNTRQSPVLAAMISQGGLRIDGSSIITSAQATNVANAIVTATTANPLVSKGDLVARIAADASFTGLLNKEARECVMRALTDAGQARTWNLMIDVIAQSGKYPQTATSLANFVVEGEKRYWLHIAIDRFTGEVIDQQLEAVYE